MKTIIQKTKQTFLLIFFIGLIVENSEAVNSKGTLFFQGATNITEIRGEVVDADSKKPLVFATLNVLDSNISSITNSEGNFVLKIPSTLENGKIVVSFLGYEPKTIAISQLSKEFNTISLNESIVKLDEVSLNSLKDAAGLVKEVLKNNAGNYLKEPAVFSAFYRESIKRRNRNVSLSEAVVDIYKSPYNSKKRDDIKIFKARKSTDYKRLDTVAFKLQGGPFNSLFLDIIKYPEYIFGGDFLSYYDFSFEQSTEINDTPIYVVKFQQKEGINDPLYQGKLYIDPVSKILVTAIYSLNITNSKDAGELYVKSKPKNATVYPEEVVYRVDYKESNGKWHYSYGNAQLKFKINWDKKLFNTTYTMNCEMVVTDWQVNLPPKKLGSKDFIKSSMILTEEASGFSDPDFWGQHNIIEPEKNIETAIKKIQKQFEKSKKKQGTSSAS